MYFAFLLKNTVYGGFVLSVLTMILSNLVAVEITSHQNSLLSCLFTHACIKIALALPIKVGIFLSTTEFCWALLIKKLHPGFVCHTLSGDFCFLHCCQALFFSPQFLTCWTKP